MKPRTLVLDVVAGPLYWVILASAVGTLLRGHNEPGGGFIGGLLAVAASVLWAVAHGSAAAARRMPLGAPLPLAAGGVLVAFAAGLPALVRGHAYLTHLWVTLPLGVVDLPLSTVLVFDLGVFLAVWGALGGYALALLADDSDAAAR